MQSKCPGNLTKITDLELGRYFGYVFSTHFHAQVS